MSNRRYAEGTTVTVDRDPEADDADDCTVCGGEGFTECDDPFQCTSPHLGGRFDSECECSACGGSGLAKDQTVW